MVPYMKRFIALSFFAAIGLASALRAKEAPTAHPTVTCSPKDTIEQEAAKYVEYYVDGKQHIEYCVNGKKQVIVDHGQNG